MLELIVYVGLIAVVGGPLVSVVLISSRGVAEHSTMHQVEERNLVSIYRLTQEVRTALNTSVIVLNGGKTLTFTLPDSFDGVAVVPGDTIRYDLQLSPEELANAADDNGNGLVDEGRVLRTNVTTGEIVALCENLDPSQSLFSWDGTTVTLTIANVGSLSSINTVFGITRSLAMVPRN
jgi:hypothetical protein